METELRERIVVDGAEAAAGKLGILSAAAQRVHGAFHGITEIAGAFSGIAGAWKIVEGIHDVDRLYQAVMRVQDMTGLAAEKAHAMFDMFELSGIEMGTGERIITSMTRKGAQLADGLAGVGGTTQKLTSLMKEFGVSIKDGPNEKILALAKAAQAGKLDLNELISGFAIPRGSAAQMMSMLKQGPDKLREIQKDTMAGADAIDDRTLNSYRNMLQVRRELGDAWGDLVGVFYKNLIPAITLVLKTIKEQFDSIAPIAAAIGSTLSAHMSFIVSATKTYLALLVAAKAINMVTPDKLGPLARGRQLFGGAIGFFQKERAAAGAMDYFEAKAAGGGHPGMFAEAGGGVAGAVMKIFNGIGPLFARLGGAISGMLPAIIAAGPAVLIMVAVVGAIVAAVRVLQSNFLGLRDRLREVLGPLLEHLRNIWGKLSDAFITLWNAIKPLFGAFGVMLVSQLITFAWWLGKLAWLIEKTIDLAIAASPAMSLFKKFGDMFSDSGDADRAVDEGARGAGKAPVTNMDFRGSKFEITNNFPQGIDGGRVAVAFSDELAQLGERRLDSGVRPLFSYR